MMEKKIIRIVLTGGPAAGKTTLLSRIMKEFKQEDGWRVIPIPESATELIGGFGIKPFGNCLSMLAFQDFVIADQLHKERLALDAALRVPEQNILILYDRALFDDKAYISDDEFAEIVKRLSGKTEDEVMKGYDAVIHLVTCAKGAEYAYNYGNAARYETIEEARKMDDRTLQCWGPHPNLRIIDNSVDFEDKIERAMREIYRFVGTPAPAPLKHKYLIEKPDMDAFTEKYAPAALDMMQTYLTMTMADTDRRIRQQKNGQDYLYFYTERQTMPDGSKLVTEKPISEKEYIRYLMEGDSALRPVRKTKFRFVYENRRFEMDVYPFSEDKAILFCYTEDADPLLPPDIRIIQDVTGDPAYKNKKLASIQML